MVNKTKKMCYPVVAITGHRPGSLSKDQRQYMQEGLKFIADGLVEYYGVERFLTGLALGADTIWAELAISYGIEYDAYIPFEGQEERWVQSDKTRYRELRSSASSEKVFGQQFSNRLYHTRNACGCMEAIGAKRRHVQHGTEVAKEKSSYIIT